MTPGTDCTVRVQFLAQLPDGLRGPAALPSNEQRALRGVKLATQLEVMLTSATVELFLHAPMSSSHSVDLSKYRDKFTLHGFHFHHRNSITFPIESLAHDSGRTLVCAEYGYPKGSPNTNSYRRNPPLQLSIQCSPQRTSKWPNSKPH
jgi:hypothetical protein